MQRPCIKVMAVGDADCGKSSLLNVFSKNKRLYEDTPTTLNNEFVNIEVCGNEVTLCLFSAAGETFGMLAILYGDRVG